MTEDEKLARRVLLWANNGDTLGIRFWLAADNFCSPPDTEQKFNVNTETGLWRCWHENRCGKSGTFWEFQKELGDEPQGLQEQVKRVR